MFYFFLNCSKRIHTSKLKVKPTHNHIFTSAYEDSSHTKALWTSFHERLREQNNQEKRIPVKLKQWYSPLSHKLLNNNPLLFWCIMIQLMWSKAHKLLIPKYIWRAAKTYLWGENIHTVGYQAPGDHNILFQMPEILLFDISEPRWWDEYGCHVGTSEASQEQDRACILTLFKTIWNCRENIKNNVAKCCILTVIEAILNCREDFKSRDAKWWILTAFETILKYREKIENKDAKWYILTVFEMIWNRREQKWKQGPKTVHSDGIWNDLES